VFFCWKFYVIAKVAIISIGRFSQIWLHTKYDSNFLKTSFYNLATYLKPYLEIWKNFLNFGRILAIENLKRHMILQLLIFNVTFWL